MFEITRRAVVTGLASLAAPLPSAAGLPIPELGPAIAPVPAVPVQVQVPAPIEISFEQMLGARFWDEDLYGGRIALWQHYTQPWRWATLRHDVVTTGIRWLPNQHHFFQLQADFAAENGEGLEAVDAVEAGWIALGEPLDAEHVGLLKQVRFGRIGVIRARIHLDAAPDAIDWCDWFGRDDLTADLDVWPSERPLFRAFNEHHEAIKAHDDERDRAWREALR